MCGANTIYTSNTQPLIAETHIFSIPPEWRPSSNRVVAAMTGLGMARFNVYQNGEVHWYPDVGLVQELKPAVWIGLMTFSYLV